ncbi:hypothetical protein C8J56DRAFT_728054, partial [Mycena floridula]
DLSGRLGLVFGMPIYVIDNIAVELGISKGSGGTLVSIEYKVHQGRRYAISAKVDLLLYTSSDPEAESPHRVTLPLLTLTISWINSGVSKPCSARRRQLPIIPGFTFTSHNSQGQ